MKLTTFKVVNNFAILILILCIGSGLFKVAYAQCLYKEGTCGGTWSCADPIDGIPDIVMGTPSSACKIIPNLVIIGDRATCNKDKKTKYIEGRPSGYCARLWYLNSTTNDCTDRGGYCGDSINGQRCNSVSG